MKKLICNVADLENFTYGKYYTCDFFINISPVQDPYKKENSNPLLINNNGELVKVDEKFFLSEDEFKIITINKRFKNGFDDLQ